MPRLATTPCLPSPACSLTLRYAKGVEAAVSMLRQLPQLQTLDLQLTNIVKLFDPDSDSAAWIGGMWIHVRMRRAEHGMLR